VLGTPIGLRRESFDETGALEALARLSRALESGEELDDRLLSGAADALDPPAAVLSFRWVRSRGCLQHATRGE
jgi:hypothetical protein